MNARTYRTARRTPITRIKLDNQKRARNDRVMVRLAKKVAGKSKVKVTSVIAFRESMTSERRVDSRFDSYRPNMENIRCQRKKRATRKRKFPNLTGKVKRSWSEILPRFNTITTVVKPSDNPSRPRSTSLAMFVPNRRLAGFN